MSSQPTGQFPTTAWSMVRATKDRQSPRYMAAMNRFIAGYWRPVFYFVRAKGYPLQRAEDLTQEFFLQFLERDWLDRADPQRGRFRTFLLTILVRFLSDQSPRRAPKQKVFDERLVAISALMSSAERQFEPQDNETPEDVFEKQWAKAVLDNVLRNVSRWCADRGRPDWYEVFYSHHFPPPGTNRVTKQSLADRFRLSRDQVRHAIEQVNLQFVELLRAEVVGQVNSEADVDAEIRQLESCFGE